MEARADDRLCHFVLDFEDIGQFPIIALGPNVLFGLGFDQLQCHADPAARSAHTALDDIMNAEVPGHVLDPGRFTFVGEGRVPGDHHQVLEAGQFGDNVLGDPVREVFLFRIARHVVEGQNRDHRFFRGIGGGAGNDR